jgi:hypothetical protein
MEWEIFFRLFEEEKQGTRKSHAFYFGSSNQRPRGATKLAAGSKLFKDALRLVKTADSSGDYPDGGNPRRFNPCYRGERVVHLDKFLILIHL